MASIDINLGSVTITDNDAQSGLLTQQDMQNWLDNVHDSDGAGANYVSRMRTALREIGVQGVSRGVSFFKRSQARASITKQDGLVDDSE